MIVIHLQFNSILLLLEDLSHRIEVVSENTDDVNKHRLPPYNGGHYLNYNFFARKSLAFCSDRSFRNSNCIDRGMGVPGYIFARCEFLL